MFDSRRRQDGFSLIEILIVISIMVMILGGIFVSFEYALKLIADTRIRTTALSLANDRMELIRSLPYDAVGTIAGIPAGAIPQNRSVNLNGKDFNERVLIQNIDDPADGLGSLDGNGILADYKTVKVEYTWFINQATSTLFLLSTIVPRSIETNGGGGTLRVNVFDAGVTPLPGILVRLINTTTTSTVDMSTFTNANGSVLFTGAPAAADYEIFVSAPGFSSDQTRRATTTLPNPTTLPVAVLEGDVSTMNFQIDRLSSLNVTLLSSRVISSSTLYFRDLTAIATSTDLVIESDTLRLTEVGGIYSPSGQAFLIPVSPSPLLRWGFLETSLVLPTGTSFRYQFYTSTSSADIVPDTAIPGNSAGFTTNQVDLRALPVATYPTLVIGLNLETTNTSVTPQIEFVRLSHVETETPRAGTPFTIRGNKTIGTLADSSPVAKVEFTATTNGSGTFSTSTLEWDEYRFVPAAGERVVEACPSLPFNLLPNSTLSTTFITQSTSAHTLRLRAETSSAQPIIGALVTIVRPGINRSANTSWCGQVFFDSLVEEVDYVLEVSAPGFATSTLSNFSVSGGGEQTVVLIVI
jgi:prepilin-type N-terminal cleavage/methylation domain-containing protein